MNYADDQKWAIPERWRASLDITDEAANALLRANDIEQQRLSKIVNSPFSRTSPRAAYRKKSYITIETLLKTRQFQKLTKVQNEQLSEAFASVGRYDFAADTTKDKAKKKVYKQYFDAVFLDDEATCPHGDHKKHIKEWVFSLRHGKEMALIACSVCGHLNVTETPDALVQRRQAQNEHRGKTTNMTIQESLKYHQSNVKKK